MVMANINKKLLIAVIVFFFILILLFIVAYVLINKNKANQQNYNSVNNTTTPLENKSILDKVNSWLKNIQNPDKNNVSNSTSETSFSTNSNSIADKVSIWLKSMKNSSDSQYHYSLNCINKNNCQLTPPDKQIAISVLWSQYEHYKNSKNNIELGQMEQDIIKYSKRSEIVDKDLRIYQLDFWHCRFLFEMAKDSVFNNEYKDYLKNICQNNNYYLARTNLIDILNTNNLSIIFPKNQRVFAINNAIISDFISMYSWFADDQLLKIANMYFVNAKNYYLKNNLSTVDSSYLTIASLDLYLATKDQTYLDFANELYNKFSSADRNNLNINQLTELCYTSQFYYDNILKEQKYLTIKNDSVSKVIDKGFDYNKGAFHSFDSNGYSYETRNNALLIKCLIN